MIALSKILTVLSSKDVKKLIENFFSLSILKFVNLILPFVTLPYLIKVLGFQHYGAIILGLSLINYFQSITDYGFNLSATREIAKHRHSKKQLNFIYSKTLLSKFFLLIFSLLLIFPIILFVPQFHEDILVYLLMCLILIGQTFFPEWFFRGMEQMRYITILDLIIKLTFTIGTFLFIKEKSDYWIYPLLLGGGYIVVAIQSHFLIYKKFQLSFNLPKLRNIKKTLKEGFPLFVNQFTPTLFNNTTNFMVGMVIGKSAAGVFGSIRQIIQLLTVFNSVVSTVFFPYLIRYKEKFYVYSKLYIIFFIILSFFIALFHHWILEWIGIHAKNASEVFYILLLGVMSIVLYSIYSTNYLISRGHDKLVMKFTVLVSLIGFILSYPLVKFLGLVGAAFNIFICQFLLGGLAYFNFRKLERKKYDF